MTWACIAASETGLLIFIDKVIHDDRSRMNSYANLSSYAKKTMTQNTVNPTKHFITGEKM